MAKEGSYPGRFKKLQFVLHGFGEGIKFKLNNGALDFSTADTDFFNALGTSDPQYLATMHSTLKVLTSETSLVDGEILLNW